MSVRRESGLYAPSRTPTPVRVPTSRLGRYEILERLALGGMAEVYLATHGELSGFRTLVVVKKVLPHLAENPQFIAMFLDEARIAALLDHPNVVRIIEVGKSGGEYFVAMELVQGKPLAGFFKRSVELDEPIAPKIAAYIVSHAAAGLHHAHNLTDADGKLLGLVHRDVSPQNILLSFEGSVKVIDFGIARALGRLSETSTGGMKGKIGYMAPEMARGEDVDHRTDIFGLGVVLWETICGQRLFERDSEFASMHATLEHPIPRPSSIIFKVPAALDNIVMRALARDPRERFQSAADMAAALDRYVVQAGGTSGTDLAALMKFFFGEEQVKWKATVRAVLDSPPTTDSITPLSAAEAAVPPPALPTPLPPMLSAPAPPRRSLAPVALAVAALGMAALGAMGVRALSGPKKPTPVVTRTEPARPTGISIEPLPAPARPIPSTKPPAEPASEPSAPEMAAVPGDGSPQYPAEPHRPPSASPGARPPRHEGGPVRNEGKPPRHKTAAPDRRPNPF